MVVWLEYLVSRGHECPYTCDHRKVRGRIFTLWDWEWKEENLNEIFKVQQVVLANYSKNNFQLVYDTETSYGNSQCLFCYVGALESHCASDTNVNLQFSLFCAPKTKSLHEVTRAAGVCVLASWKVQRSAIWRWNCTFILQRMLCVNCSDCQFCGQGFSSVSIPRCFSSLLAFLFVATAVSEDVLCPRLLPEQIVALTLLLSNRVIPVKAEDQLSSAFIFWITIVYEFIYHWCN